MGRKCETVSLFLPECALGFSQFAYAGLETGSRSVTSYALKQGKAQILLSTSVEQNGFFAEHLRKHGDAVRDIAFHVNDADEAFQQAVNRGATAFEEPRTVRMNTVVSAGPPFRPMAIRSTR